jgi:hypothetical protein
MGPGAVARAAGRAFRRMHVRVGRPGPVVGLLLIFALSVGPGQAVGERAEPSPAQRSSAPRELTELRTATSRTYVGDDGTRVARVYSGAVNFRERLSMYDSGKAYAGVLTRLPPG